MNREVKRLLQDVVKLDDVLGHEDDAPSLEAMAKRAKKLLESTSSARTRKLEKTRPDREAKAGQVLANLEAHQELRQRAYVRSMGRCELCDVSLGVNEACHLHHLEGGSSKTKNEKLSNVMVVHPACHEAAHMNIRSTVPAVKAWCFEHGYPLPRRKEFRDE
jgi:hypothetical protein